MNNIFNILCIIQFYSSFLSQSVSVLVVTSLGHFQWFSSNKEERERERESARCVIVVKQKETNSVVWETKALQKRLGTRLGFGAKGIKCFDGSKPREMYRKPKSMDYKMWRKQIRNAKTKPKHGTRIDKTRH